MQTLSEVVDAKAAEIMEKTKLSGNDYQRSMGDLRERGLVAWTKQGKHSIFRFSMTMAGARALADHISHKQKMLIDPSKAISAKVNLMATDHPTYKPMAPEYPTYRAIVPFCRNDGHRCARSLGAFT